MSLGPCFRLALDGQSESNRMNSRPKASTTSTESSGNFRLLAWMLRKLSHINTATHTRGDEPLEDALELASRVFEGRGCVEDWKLDRSLILKAGKRNAR